MVCFRKWKVSEIWEKTLISKQWQPCCGSGSWICIDFLVSWIHGRIQVGFSWRSDLFHFWPRDKYTVLLLAIKKNLNFFFNLKMLQKNLNFFFNLKMLQLLTIKSLVPDPQWLGRIAIEKNVDPKLRSLNMHKQKVVHRQMSFCLLCLLCFSYMLFGLLLVKTIKLLQLEKNLISFESKNAIDLSLGLHKGRPSYRRSLQPSKENIQHFKTWKFLYFFCGSFFALLSGFRIRIRIRIHWPDWIRIHTLSYLFVTVQGQRLDPDS